MTEEVRCPVSDDRCPKKSDDRCPVSEEVRCPMTGVRCPMKSNVQCRLSNSPAEALAEAGLLFTLCLLEKTKKSEDLSV